KRVLTPAYKVAGAGANAMFLSFPADPSFAEFLFVRNQDQGPEADPNQYDEPSLLWRPSKGKQYRQDRCRHTRRRRVNERPPNRPARGFARYKSVDRLPDY